MERLRRAELWLLLVLVLAPSAGLAQAQEPTLVRLSDAVGDTIDLAERDSFHLFPNTAGFRCAVILGLPGSRFFANVAQANGDSLTPVYYRILPGQMERIRFLVDYPEFVVRQQKLDSTAVQSLTAFWQAIEEHPLPSMAGEPAAGQKPPAVTGENRYYHALDGMTIGSMIGGCIGSHAGITYVRTEEPECLFPPVSVYHVDPCVFWGASCGITALGTGAGYALGSKFDRDEPVQMTRLKEGTGWRTGLALGALVPGAALGYYAFLVLGISRYGVMRDLFDRIENDPDDRTVLPMLFTGLCIAVESATIGYRIGRAIDRRNAEKAEAKRRALGR